MLIYLKDTWVRSYKLMTYRKTCVFTKKNRNINYIFNFPTCIV